MVEYEFLTYISTVAVRDGITHDYVCIWDVASIVTHTNTNTPPHLWRKWKHFSTKHNNESVKAIVQAKTPGLDGNGNHLNKGTFHSNAIFDKHMYRSCYILLHFLNTNLHWSKTLVTTVSDIFCLRQPHFSQLTSSIQKVL